MNKRKRVYRMINGEVLKCLNRMIDGMLNVEGGDAVFVSSFMNFGFSIS